MNLDLLNLCTALTPLFSALAGGLFVLLGVIAKDAIDRGRQKEQDQASLLGFQQMIRSEVEVLYGRYKEGIGKSIASVPDGKFMEAIFPITDVNYFTVYENNSNLIGKIQDNELRKLIVTTYTQAKSMLDSIRMNNSMLQRLEELFIRMNESKNSTYRSLFDAEQKALGSYAIALKEQHAELDKNVTELLKKLQISSGAENVS